MSLTSAITSAACEAFRISLEKDVPLSLVATGDCPLRLLDFASRTSTDIAACQRHSDHLELPPAYDCAFLYYHNAWA